MELNNLKPAFGSTQKSKRIGRGQGSGHGGTSTKGHKGQKAVSGFNDRRGREGGTMPLWMRTPKRGFKNLFRVEYVGINLSRIQEIVEKFGVSDSLDINKLVELGIVSSGSKVKILAHGELTTKLNITANGFSEKAKIAVEALGGTATVI